MYIFKFEFFDLNDNILLEFKSINKSIVENIINELLSIFAYLDKSNKPTICVNQQYSIKVKNDLDLFINKHKSKYKALYSLAAFFNKKEINEGFCFLPNIELEKRDRIILTDTLRAMKEGKVYEDLKNKTLDLFDELIINYSSMVVGEKRVKIGEWGKYKRTCRFCNKAYPKVTFNNKAHAISEALGNKNIILLEECDACNFKFSKTIEPDIIQYFSLFRTIFNIKGKGGSKILKGKNFSLSHDENPHIELKNGNVPIIKDNKYKINLVNDNPIIHQNIYKSLCKYFLSVIDQQHLQYYKKTIQWINGDYIVDKLPFVACKLSYNTFSIQPKIACYIKKNNDQSLPYAIGEFYFACWIYIFIIPFTSQDEINFTEKKHFKKIWNVFKHINAPKDLVYKDLSSLNPIKYKTILNFKTKN